MPPAVEAGCDAPLAFLPARPITPADLAALGVWLVFSQENVPDPFRAKGKRDRHRLLPQTEPVPAAAAADMLAWENSGLSVDASVRITLFRLQLRVYWQSLEHLLRYCARPPFVLERLSVSASQTGYRHPQALSDAGRAALNGRASRASHTPMPPCPKHAVPGQRGEAGGYGPRAPRRHAGDGHVVRPITTCRQDTRHRAAAPPTGTIDRGPLWLVLNKPDMMLNVPPLIVVVP